MERPERPGGRLLRRAAVSSAVILSLLVAAAATADVEGSDGRAGLHFGLYSPPAPESGIGDIDALASTLERPVDVVLSYQQWSGSERQFNPSWVANVVRSGRIPLLTWEPWAPGPANQSDYRLRLIARGAFDSYIGNWARALKSFGKVVYLRPMHEMNGNWYPWGGTVNQNSPRLFVAAWRRMWTIFAGAGAGNVRWVWSPLAEDVPRTAANRFERYYPGARYVDVLALDGYNWGSTFPQYGGWRSFAQIFANGYGRIAALGPQPIWIAETASAPEGGDKAAWVHDMFTWVGSRPRIHALVWFNVNKERDWRATSAADVIDSFSMTPRRSRGR